MAVKIYVPEGDYTGDSQAIVNLLKKALVDDLSLYSDITVADNTISFLNSSNETELEKTGNVLSMINKDRSFRDVTVASGLDGLVKIYVTKTSAVCLFRVSYTGAANSSIVIFTKDRLKSASVVCTCKNNTGSDQPNRYMGSACVAFASPNDSSASWQSHPVTPQTGPQIVTLMPFVFDTANGAANYTPNAGFVVTGARNAVTSLTWTMMELNGKTYLTNTYWAFEDEEV